MAREMTLKFQGKDLKIKLESEADESVYEEIFIDRDYKILDEYLKKAKVIVDIGAHIGLFGLYASVLAPHDAAVFCYEPEEKNYAALKWHLKENRIRNVQTKNLAVAGKDGDRRIFLSEDSHNHSFYGSGESRNVATISIARLMSRIDKCDVVKMDCEGAEFEIVEAMDRAIFDRISTIYIEYHEDGAGKKASVLSDKLRCFYGEVKIFPSRYEKSMGFVWATNVLYNS